MFCRYECEGADWSHGGTIRRYCDLTGEVDPDCENCDYISV